MKVLKCHRRISSNILQLLSSWKESHETNEDIILGSPKMLGELVQQFRTTEIGILVLIRICWSLYFEVCR